MAAAVQVEVAEPDSVAEICFPDDSDLPEAGYQVSRQRAVSQSRLPAESQAQELWMAEPKVN